MTERKSQKSIVLVTVDCLRADHVGFGGYRRASTPFLDTLAEESFIFPAAIVAGAPTYYSFPAILGARSPLALGRDVLGLAPTEPTMASEMKRAGYATAAFSAANPYLSARFGYDQGFDTFHDFLDDKSLAKNGEPKNLGRKDGWAARLNRALYDASRTVNPAARIYDELYFQYCQHWAMSSAESFDSLRRFPSADEIVDQAAAWLASVGRQPFFLWLHLMDPHAPYYPTEKALHLMGDDRVSANRARYLNSFWQRDDVGARRLSRHREDVVALYDAGIRWVDAQMARLADTLRNLELWQNCIFALTGDHGEEFLDHGGRYHAPARLMEELIRVPLLVRVPEVAKDAKRDATKDAKKYAKKELPLSPFSLVDLSPTLMDAAQINPPSEFHGRSRWPQMQQGSGWDTPAIVECVAGCTNPFHRDRRQGPRLLAVREARYKLVLEFDPAADRLYDLEADPRELSPLPSSAEKPVRCRLLEYARRHIERSNRGRDSALLLRARIAELRLEWAKPMHTSQTAGF